MRILREFTRTGSGPSAIAGWIAAAAGCRVSTIIMKTGILLTAVAVWSVSLLSAQDAEEVTGLLNQLRRPDLDARRDAIAGLQTSLDPRIPDACLPLLRSEGDSIRRLAARAIGSRWHQIPRKRVPEFTAALRGQLQSQHTGLVNMARRGIALLERDYSGAMVSRSKSGRWVIYERRGLPCLIDTRTATEELLGFGGGAMMSCASGNDELAPTVKWHPKKDIVAMDITVARKLSTIWFWTHGKGLRQLSFDEQIRALGLKPGQLAPAAGFFATSKGWSGDTFEYELNYTVVHGEDFTDRSAKLRWDSSTDRLSVLADRKLD